MSYVIAVASKEFVIIKSDGRATADSGTITNEKYDKTFSLSDTVIGGFTGNAYLSAKTLHLLRSRKEYHHDPDSAILAIRDIMRDILPEVPGMNAAFVVGGMSLDVVPVLNTCSSSHGLEICRNTRACYELAISSFGSPVGQTMTKDLLNEYLADNRSIEAAMDSAIFRVSALDSAVNDVVFTRKIIF